MKKWAQIIVMLGILPSFFFFSHNVKAEGEVGFNIQAVLPENQQNENDSFFNLRMKAGQKQTIKIVLNNTSNKETAFEINVNQAYTNNQGFIDYTDKQLSKSSSNAPYKIDDLITYKKEITVAAKSSVKVPFHLSMPAELFDGEILAGIQVVKKEKEDKASIKNSVGYVLGLKLTETDKNIKRHLNLTTIKTKALFGKPTIIATLENSTMESYGHLKYDVKILEKDKKTVFYETVYDNDMQLAPNSSYPFAIELKDKALSAGDFVLDLRVTDAKNNKWEFTKAFKVTPEQATKINQLTIDKDTPSKIPLLVWILSIVIILGVVILLVITLKKGKFQK